MTVRQTVTRSDRFCCRLWGGWRGPAWLQHAERQGHDVGGRGATRYQWSWRLPGQVPVLGQGAVFRAVQPSWLQLYQGLRKGKLWQGQLRKGICWMCEYVLVAVWLIGIVLMLLRVLLVLLGSQNSGSGMGEGWIQSKWVITCGKGDHLLAKWILCQLLVKKKKKMYVDRIWPVCIVGEREWGYL